MSYFGRKRCLSPDDLADETLTRVARRLEEEGAITDTSPARYCYIVARFVFLEHVRSADRRHTSLDETRAVADAAALARLAGVDDTAEEARHDDLERCLQQLSGADRALHPREIVPDEGKADRSRHPILDGCRRPRL